MIYFRGGSETCDKVRQDAGEGQNWSNIAWRILSYHIDSSNNTAPRLWLEVCLPGFPSQRIGCRKVHWLLYKDIIMPVVLVGHIKYIFSGWVTQMDWGTVPQNLRWETAQAAVSPIFWEVVLSDACESRPELSKEKAPSRKFFYEIGAVHKVRHARGGPRRCDSLWQGEGVQEHVTSHFKKIYLTY